MSFTSHVQTDIEEIDSDFLKKTIAEKKENEFSLIDVREENEFEEGHIPGAILMSLSKLEKSMDLIPEGRDIILYCRSGVRSMTASRMIADSEKGNRVNKIFSLNGGYLKWTGATIDEPPKVGIFRSNQGGKALLHDAIRLEKGAFQFYSYLYENFKDLPYRDTLNILKKAETAHAKLIFSNLASDHGDFEEFFDSVSDNILESGMTTEEAVEKAASFSENRCINILEFLLSIEVAAYDLYKVMAQKEAEDIFLKIAQEEKSHMRLIASSFILCS